jgi:hypothetical protein
MAAQLVAPRVVLSSAELVNLPSAVRRMQNPKFTVLCISTADGVYILRPMRTECWGRCTQQEFSPPALRRTTIQPLHTKPSTACNNIRRFKFIGSFQISLQFYNSGLVETAIKLRFYAVLGLKFPRSNVHISYIHHILTNVEGCCLLGYDVV